MKIWSWGPLDWVAATILVGGAAYYTTLIATVVA